MSLPAFQLGGMAGTEKLENGPFRWTFFNPVLHSSLLLPWGKHQVESVSGTTRRISMV